MSKLLPKKESLQCGDASHIIREDDFFFQALEAAGEVNVERTRGYLSRCISTSPFTPCPQHTHSNLQSTGMVWRSLAKLPDSAALEIKDKQTPNKLEKKGKFNIKNNF